jgi:hypothetical protein
MPDNTSIRHGSDRTRVSVEQEHEVRYWTEALGCTREELEQAVRTVGNNADAVRGWLKNNVH